MSDAPGAAATVEAAADAVRQSGKPQYTKKK